MKIPKTIEELDNLVKTEIPESLYLDYKASPALSKAKRYEICKDISSFANSDGGILIYGIIEEDDLPIKLDDGVNIDVINREWIDQIVSTHITPAIEGIEIYEIKKSEKYSFFVINIPKSFRGPHQSADKKYYKRYNFRSSPMEHYEIEDIRNRKNVLPQLVNFDVELEGQLIKLKIENNGDEIAHDVEFKFPEGFKWYRGEYPHALKSGIKFFPPGRKIVFTLGTTFTILGKDSKFEPFFDVAISYIHSLSGNKTQETVHINFNDYLDSTVTRDPLIEISKSLGTLSSIQKELQTINKYIDNFKGIAGATGIDLSLTTLKNLRHIHKGSSEFEPINFRYSEYDVIMEVLGIDSEMAFRIYDHFHYNPEDKPLEKIEGITEELLQKIKALIPNIGSQN
ncbi:MAG: ATP-binding protein [Bacteroidales bacterium]|nr:ATP-binding protein [Bacteroidales bacterium]